MTARLFKYLPDDNKVARIFLSAFIGTEILELEFCPTEHNLKLARVDFTVFRMDFTAKVCTEDGRDKMILICSVEKIMKRNAP